MFSFLICVSLYLITSIFHCEISISPCFCFLQISRGWSWGSCNLQHHDVRLRFDLGNSLGFASDATTTEARFLFWRYPNGFAVATPDSDSLDGGVSGCLSSWVFFCWWGFGIIFWYQTWVQVCHDLGVSWLERWVFQVAHPKGYVCGWNFDPEKGMGYGI